MSNWKTAYRSFYYEGAPEPADPVLARGKTALLVIDVQNTYIELDDPATLSGEAVSRRMAWQPFLDRMNGIVLPNIAKLLAAFRARGDEVAFARIACQTADGRDRSLSQKKPGWNNLLLPKDQHASQIVASVGPVGDDVVVIKTTDSALTGTNLRLILANMGIVHVVCCGIFTDQCVSSTVRSLADESFDVIIVDDACAAATDELHAQELAILNMIYGHVMGTDDVIGYLGA